MRTTDKPHRTGVFGDIAYSDPGGEHLPLPVGEVLLVLMPADIARRLSVCWLVEQLRREELNPLCLDEGGSPPCDLGMGEACAWLEEKSRDNEIGTGDSPP